MKQRSLFTAEQPVAVERNDGPLVPRPYQDDIIERARGRMQSARRGIIQGETGSGKTVVAGKIVQMSVAKGKRCLCLADRRRLVAQFGDVMNKFGVRHGVIMSKETRSTYESCILGSRDTLLAWKKRELEMPAPFDLIVPDECHKFPANAYQDLMELWPNAYVLGLTATPARADGRPLQGYFKWIECIVPPSQLIAEGFLLKPEVYVPAEIAKRRAAGKKVDSLAGDPVSHWLEYAYGLPTIAFCETVPEALRLRDRFLSEGIASEHIEGTFSDTARDGCFDRLESGGTKVLVSVDLLIEGIDIPEVSCAILWRKFRSLVQYRQACGRIMRPAPWAGKTRCVVLDHCGASGEHGPPGEDVDWSFGPDTMQERRKKRLETNEVRAQIFCVSCGFQFEAAPICPACGRRVTTRARKTVAEKVRDELLVPFENETPGERDARVQESLDRLWVRCIYISLSRQTTAGAAVAMFKRMAGKWPEEAGVRGVPDRNQRKLPATVVFSNYQRKK